MQELAYTLTLEGCQPLLDIISLVPWELAVKIVKARGVDPSRNTSGVHGVPAQEVSASPFSPLELLKRP